MLTALLCLAQLPAPPARSLEVSYHVVLTNTEDKPKTVNLWVPVFQSNRRQRVQFLTQDLKDGRLTTESKFGNRIYFKRITMEPRSTANVNLQYAAEVTELILSKELSPRPGVNIPAAMGRYLESTSMIPLSGPMTQLASEVPASASSPMKTARGIYDYLVDRMTYNWKAPGAGKGDAVWACDSRTGDCTDYHSLFIGISRLKGIPADHFFGVALDPSKPAGTSKGWHCWAGFWTPQTDWFPIDASEADKHPEQKEYLFGGLSTRCLQISHGRDVNLNPRQKGPALNLFADPYAEVDGKRFTEVTWSCDYRNRE